MEIMMSIRSGQVEKGRSQSGCKKKNLNTLVVKYIWSEVQCRGRKKTVWDCLNNNQVKFL